MKVLSLFLAALLFIPFSAARVTRDLIDEMRARGFFP